MSFSTQPSLASLFSFAIKHKKDFVIYDLLARDIFCKIPQETQLLHLQSALEVGYLPTIALLIHFSYGNTVYDEKLQSVARKGNVHHKILEICQQKKGVLVFQDFSDAAQSGNEKGVDFYLDAGFAPQDWRTKEEGNSILHIATASCQSKIIKKCVPNISMDDPNSSGETPLFLVDEKKYKKANIEETIDTLFAYGATLTSSVLEYHVGLGHLTTVKALFKQSAQIEKLDLTYSFVTAIINGYTECATYLYKEKADLIHSSSKFKNLTPLHIAAIYSRLDLVILLIQWGANISALDKDGKLYWHYFKDETTLDAFLQKLKEKKLTKALSQIDKEKLPNDFFSFRLPDEIALAILSFLSPEQKKLASLINKNWYRLAKDKDFTLKTSLTKSLFEIEDLVNFLKITDLEKKERVQFISMGWKALIHEYKALEKIKASIEKLLGIDAWDNAQASLWCIFKIINLILKKNYENLKYLFSKTQGENFIKLCSELGPTINNLYFKTKINLLKDKNYYLNYEIQKINTILNTIPLDLHKCPAILEKIHLHYTGRYFSAPFSDLESVDHGHFE